ncbi:MAG: hypothetical protein M3Q36_00625 [bacterium]|nr:hypothetical protein [bacterium]
MKFKYSGEAADTIAKSMLNTLPHLAPNTIIVHVPSATSHVRQRGFDHAKRMAAQLSTELKLPHLPLMARTNQRRQVGYGRNLRLSQMDSAFRVRSGELIDGAHILLVDDVITTGATIESAARTLKRSGAKSVDAIIFAQAK